MGDLPTLVIGKDPVGVARQLYQNRHKVWRNGNDPLFVILRRKSFFTVATHADSRQFQIHISPSEKIKFTLAQARQNQGGEDRLLFLIASGKEPVEFFLRVRLWPALSLLPFVLEMFEPGAWIGDRETTIVDQVIEKSAQRSDFEVDGSRRDGTVMLRARFFTTFDFVIVNVSAGERLHILFASKESLEVIHHLLISLRSFGFTGRVSLDVLNKHPRGICNKSGCSLFFLRLCFYFCL